MGELAARPVGRPPGTVESIESLARKQAQRDLKMLERISKDLEGDLEKVSSALAEMAVSNPAWITLSEYRLKLKEAIGRSVAATAKIAASDPAKALEGDSDAVAAEIIKQIRGDL